MWRSAARLVQSSEIDLELLRFQVQEFRKPMKFDLES